MTTSIAFSAISTPDRACMVPRYETIRMQVAAPHLPVEARLGWVRSGAMTWTVS